MYELEIAHSDQASDSLTVEQRALFRDASAGVVGFSLLPWEEHCTECAMPACFSTCDLYEARPDGKCRRFAHGIKPLPDVPTLQGYAVKIQFKPWAQLMAYANTDLLPIEQLQRVEERFAKLDSLVTSVVGTGISIAGRKNIPARMQRRIKQWVSHSGRYADPALSPDYFLVEIFNPNTTACQLTLKLINPDPEKRNIPYQELLDVKPGFNRFKFDCAPIFNRVDTRASIHITVIPNNIDDQDAPLTLYFGSLGFVADKVYREQRQRATSDVSDADKNSPVKIVIWDLDHTMWHGVLVEDGADGVKLKPGIAEIIKTLDARGIVNSVASKNDYDNAMQQLAKFGLQEYFVFSRISWEPKGGAVKQIIKDFNVGADTAVFIDDQPFERDQVKQIEPKVRAIDAVEYQNILKWPGFNPPLSAESAGRRQSYLTQRQRDAALESFSGEYAEFLRECQIRLTVMRSAGALADRLHELVQRTNQLNFSGRRYLRDEIVQILGDSTYDHFALSCCDRYGDYGVIGFALIDKRGPTPLLKDLMLSCRVQSKRVEHAFFAYLMNLYKAQGFTALDAIYRKTDRNQPAGRVFAEIGFIVTGSHENTVNYRYELSVVPQVDVVTVTEVAP